MDDIAEIFEILSALDGGVSAETSDFAEISSAGELGHLEVDEIYDLRMTAGAGDTQMKVELGERARVTISQRNDPLLTGIVEQLRRVFGRRERPFGAWPRPDTLTDVFVVFVLAILVSFGVVGALFSEEVGGETRLRPAALWVLAGLGAASAMWALWKTVYGRNPRPYAVVVAKWEKDAPTIWTRHGSAIMISLVTNVVVAVVFFFIGIWVS